MTTAFYRMDLDKTYLATPFERKLEMLRLPFEAPEAKRTLPGMAALVRGLRQHAGVRVERSDLSILSASPTFMEDKIRAKLALDGVEVEHLLLKDQWTLIRKGRFREMANPFAYKLAALLRLGGEMGPPDFEVLVGDDWDLDPLIYLTYAELRAGRLPERTWRALRRSHPLTPELEQMLIDLAAGLAGTPTVYRIYIRREKRRGPGFYAAFGSRIRTYDDAFQLALLMYDAGLLDETAVRNVIHELQERRWRNAAFRYSWDSLRNEHRFKRFEEILRILEEIDLLPKRGLLARLRPPPQPDPEDRAPDWSAIRAAYV